MCRKGKTFSCPASVFLLLCPSPHQRPGLHRKSPASLLRKAGEAHAEKRGRSLPVTPLHPYGTSVPPSVTAVTLILPMPFGGKEKLYLKANFKSKGEITLCLSGGLYFSLQVVLMMSPLSRMATACGRMWLMVLWHS